MKKGAAFGVSVFLILALLGPARVAHGQSRAGTIFGTVTDPSGAVVPGASITATEQNTTGTRETTTDSAGRFSFPLLPVGRYTVKVSLAGFREAEAKDIELEIQDNRELNVKLALAAVEETTTVTAQAEVVEIERTTASLGQVIHQKQVADLPLNGRNFVQLGTLVPGAVKGEGTFFNNRGNTEVSIRGSVSLSVQGMRENANDWLIDGVDNNELTAGAVSILPSVDSIQEFKVLTNNYSAEYGSRGGATVIVNTKGGTNEYHGTLFEFWRNDVLDARNFFDGPEKGKFNQNQFGGSLGGPLLRGRTFFFGDYQGTTIRQGLTFLSTVPTERMRRGDFSESFPGAPARTTYDPATTTVDPATGQLVRTPFPNNQIPANRIDPIAARLLALFPLPTFADRLAGNYLSNPVKRFDQHSFNTRIDHTLSASDSLFGRFSFDDANQFFPNGLPGFGSGPSAAFSTCDFRTDARNLALSHTHIFTPGLLNQGTFGFNYVYNHMTSIGQGRNLAQELGIPGANLGDFATSGLTNIGISGGFNRLGDRLFTPFIGGTKVFHFTDTLTWVRGAHTVKMGASVRLMHMNTLGITWPHGNFNFDQFFTSAFTPTGALNAGTGHPIASTLLGLPTSGSRSNQFDGFLIGRRWEEYRGYFEDTWQVGSNLTFNLGLAYNLTTPVKEVEDRQANFVFETGQFLIPGQNSDRAAGVKLDTNNFEPRLGFAWSPGGSSTLAIRGGYGVFHDVSGNGGVQGLYLNPPFTSELGFTSDNITPVRTLATGFAPVARPDPATYAGNLVLHQLDFQQGAIQMWNVNVQQEVFAKIVATVAYAGTRARDLQSKGWNLNTAPPGPGFNARNRRPYPQFNNFNAILSRNEIDYHSLQLKGERRMADGLYFLAAYTWSKSLNNGLQQNVGVGSGVKYFPFEPWPDADRGLADTDVRHSFTLSYLYQLPFGRGRALGASMGDLAEALLGNWQINGIARMRSGYPLHMSMSVNQNGTALGNRPDRSCSGELLGSQQTADRFFDTNCFAAPPPGRFGNAARTTLSGPGLVNFDLSVFKSFRMGGSRTVQFRTEIFNLFNTAQFDLPGTVVGAANFGKIQSTISPSRQVQLALKVIF